MGIAIHSNIKYVRKCSYFRISSMGSGSDYAPFIQRVGLPCIDVRYTYDSVSILTAYEHLDIKLSVHEMKRKLSRCSIFDIFRQRDFHVKVIKCELN